MLVTSRRANHTEKVDCIQLCAENQAEVSLLNAIIENKINLKAGLFLLLKEDKLKDRKVESLTTNKTDNYTDEELRHV